LAGVALIQFGGDQKCPSKPPNYIAGPPARPAGKDAWFLMHISRIAAGGVIIIIDCFFSKFIHWLT